MTLINDLTTLVQALLQVTPLTVGANAEAAEKNENMKTKSRKMRINRQHGSSASLGGKADDRADAPAGGLWRTASWVHEKP